MAPAPTMNWAANLVVLGYRPAEQWCTELVKTQAFWFEANHDISNFAFGPNWNKKKYFRNFPQ